MTRSTIAQKLKSIAFCAAGVLLAGAGVFEIFRGEHGTGVMLFLAVPCALALAWMNWRPPDTRVRHVAKPSRRRRSSAGPAEFRRVSETPNRIRTAGP